MCFFKFLKSPNALYPILIILGILIDWLPILRDIKEISLKRKGYFHENKQSMLSTSHSASYNFQAICEYIAQLNLSSLNEMEH